MAVRRHRTFHQPQVAPAPERTQAPGIEPGMASVSHLQHAAGERQGEECAATRPHGPAGSLKLARHSHLTNPPPVCPQPPCTEPELCETLMSEHNNSHSQDLRHSPTPLTAPAL